MLATWPLSLASHLFWMVVHPWGFAICLKKKNPHCFGIELMTLAREISKASLVFGFIIHVVSCSVPECTSGYFTVDPTLLLTEVESLQLDCISQQTVLSKCLGPLSQWWESLPSSWKRMKLHVPLYFSTKAGWVTVQLFRSWRPVVVPYFFQWAVWKESRPWWFEKINQADLWWLEGKYSANLLYRVDTLAIVFMYH